MSEEAAREEMRHDHIRQLAQKSEHVRLPDDASNTMIRAAHKWSMLLDPVRPYVARHEELFRVTDGVLEVRARCRGRMVRDEHNRARHKTCGLEAWLPLEEGRISAFMVTLLQRWMCAACSEEDDAASARAERTTALQGRLRESGIPPALAAEVSWDTMLESGQTEADTKARIRAIQVCKEWASKPNPKHALLLFGDAGTGKTRLAATAALSRLAHSPIRWVSVAVLMAQLTAAWGDEDRQIALKVLTGRGPVVLDDLDKINPTATVLQQLFAAIDKREQAGERAVIFTTNRKPSELAGILGDVLMSRIAGMCETDKGLLPFPGPDRRISFIDDETGEDIYGKLKDPLAR